MKSDLRTKAEQDKFMKKLATLSPKEIKSLYMKPELFLMPHQIPPHPMRMKNGRIMQKPWRYFLLCGGRGAGKSYAGISWLFGKVINGAKSVAIVGPDFRAVENDLVPLFLACAPPDEVKKGLWAWNAQRGVIHCPNDVKVNVYTSSSEIRGPNLEYCFCDEIVKWCDGNSNTIVERFEVLDLAVRKGDYPQIFIASTPKPIMFFRRFFDKIANKDSDYSIKTASMTENPYLSASFKNVMLKKHEGTRFGAQEINGIVSFDIDGALWNPELIDKTRVNKIPVIDDERENVDPLGFFLRTVIAVDPSAGDGTDEKSQDECGIIVVGLGRDMECYVIKDATMFGSPMKWATKVGELYQEYRCDTVVAEVNNGGDMVEFILRAHLKNHRPVIKKIHANKGKLVRARPVLALQEQGEIHFVGFHSKLETELCNYAGTGKEDSPNRLDAFVYAITEIMLEDSHAPPFNYDMLPDFS